MTLKDNRYDDVRVEMEYLTYVELLLLQRRLEVMIKGREQLRQIIKNNERRKHPILEVCKHCGRNIKCPQCGTDSKTTTFWCGDCMEVR